MGLYRVMDAQDVQWIRELLFFAGLPMEVHQEVREYTRPVPTDDGHMGVTIMLMRTQFKTRFGDDVSKEIFSFVATDLTDLWLEAMIE